MMKAKDVANYLVYLMTGSCDDLTNMKLNKLLYYAQGHYLQEHGVPLFQEQIKAWPYGPVVPEVYHAYKHYQKSPIHEYDEEKANKIDDNIKDYLINIARTYGRYTANALSDMTHKPGSPWACVEAGEDISIDSIRTYFLNNEKEIGPLTIDFSEEDFVGHRDSDGILVLPEEWNDEAI